MMTGPPPRYLTTPASATGRNKNTKVSWRRRERYCGFLARPSPSPRVRTPAGPMTGYIQRRKASFSGTQRAPSAAMWRAWGTHRTAPRAVDAAAGMGGSLGTIGTQFGTMALSTVRRAAFVTLDLQPLRIWK